jgi:hypothetical protein
MKGSFGMVHILNFQGEDIAFKSISIIGDFEHNRDRDKKNKLI